jgi:NTE family protein
MKKGKSDKGVALVLSSGGARGIAHIGVIEALLDKGFHIQSIAGCSMGAVVGGVYAAGKLPEFKEWICDLDKVDLFKLFDFTLSSQGFIKGEKVFKELEKFVSDCNIEDLPIPFCAVAVDINKEKEVVFKKGSLFEAMRASAAIPSIITPAIIGNVELVDGGVLNPMPLGLVYRKDGDMLVAVDVNARGKYHWPEAIKTKEPLSENDYTAKLEAFANKLRSLWGRNETKKDKKIELARYHDKKPRFNARQVIGYHFRETSTRYFGKLAPQCSRNL